jgi:hypothetical protein
VLSELNGDALLFAGCASPYLVMGAAVEIMNRKHTHQLNGMVAADALDGHPPYPARVKS